MDYMGDRFLISSFIIVNNAQNVTWFTLNFYQFSMPSGTPLFLTFSLGWHPISPSTLELIWGDKMPVWWDAMRWMTWALWPSVRLLLTWWFVRRRLICSRVIWGHWAIGESLIFEVIETVKSETVENRGLLYRINIYAKIKVSLQGEPYQVAEPCWTFIFSNCSTWLPSATTEAAFGLI